MVLVGGNSGAEILESNEDDLDQHEGNLEVVEDEKIIEDLIEKEDSSWIIQNIQKFSCMLEVCFEGLEDWVIYCWRLNGEEKRR